MLFLKISETSACAENRTNNLSESNQSIKSTVCLARILITVESGLYKFLSCISFVEHVLDISKKYSLHD